LSFATVQNSGGGFVSNTSASVTFGSSTTAGNLVVVALQFAGSLPTITPPAGFILAKSANQGSSSVALYYLPNCGVLTSTGNFTWTGSLTGRILGIEYSGFGATVNIDQTNNATGSSTTASSGSITTTKTPSAVLAVFGITVVGAPSGPTNSFALDAASGGGTNNVSIFRLNQNATGTTSTSVTISNTNWAGCIANFYSPGRGLFRPCPVTGLGTGGPFFASPLQ
jgi:hypothetical protein